MKVRALHGSFLSLMEAHSLWLTGEKWLFDRPWRMSTPVP